MVQHFLRKIILNTYFWGIFFRMNKNVKFRNFFLWKMFFMAIFFKEIFLRALFFKKTIFNFGNFFFPRIFYKEKFCKFGKKILLYHFLVKFF